MRRIDVVRVQLVREGVLPYRTRQVCHPADAAALAAEHIGGADREHFVLIMLDTKARVLAVHTVSIGTLDSSSAHPREVFKAAILANAAGIVLAHNHPSGDPAPSPQDIEVTRRLAECGRLLGIEVLDHIVIGDAGRYASLKERGIIF